MVGNETVSRNENWKGIVEVAMGFDDLIGHRFSNCSAHLLCEASIFKKGGTE